MTTILSSSPGLAITLVLLILGSVGCTIAALVLSRQGLSLRPVAWFYGFFLLIVLPQVLGHLRRAWVAERHNAPRAAAWEQLKPETDPGTRLAAARLLFGADADPERIADVRAAFGEAFTGARSAWLAAFPNGETVLFARFSGWSAAEKAWVAYLRVTGLNQLSGQGDSQRGYAVTRPAGDRVFALHLGDRVGVWSALKDEQIRARMAAMGLSVPRRAPLADDGSSTATVRTDSAAPIPVSDGLPLHPAILGVIGAAYLLLVVVYFFKGAAWAGTRGADPGATSVSMRELASRLEALNSLDIPFRVERGADPGEWVATWRYADAKWLDLARARGIRRVHRIRMRLDEQARTLRATDETSSLEASLGRGGAGFEWKSELGIVFFQTERVRVFGLQIDSQGRPQPQLSYAYRFSLEEMKSPLVQAVTRAGWRWRPVVWQGPAWLRWLTD